MSQLESLYHSFTGCEPFEMNLLPLSGSARKYYRITGEGGTFIACIGTNPAENRAFLAIDEAFCEHCRAAPELETAGSFSRCPVISG